MLTLQNLLDHLSANRENIQKRIWLDLYTRYGVVMDDALERRLISRDFTGFVDITEAGKVVANTRQPTTAKPIRQPDPTPLAAPETPELERATPEEETPMDPPIREITVYDRLANEFAEATEPLTVSDLLELTGELRHKIDYALKGLLEDKVIVCRSSGTGKTAAKLYGRTEVFQAPQEERAEPSISVAPAPTDVQPAPLAPTTSNPSTDDLVDPEARAIDACVSKLKNLEWDARPRVLKYLEGRFPTR
jgi:hypothetical protein